MSEESTPAERRHRGNDSALATSSPDFNWSVLSLARYLFRVGHDRPLLALIAWPLASVIVLALVIFITALPSLNGMTIWADKKAEADAAERAFEIEKLKVTAEIEANKAAADRGHSSKLDQILETTQQTDVTVRAIGEDVQRLDDRVTKIEDAHRRRR
jgi:hypothetical protein